MSKRVYISADYSEVDGDREVVEVLNKWGKDDLHKVEFIDMAKVVSGSVSAGDDCRICDLKDEFNRQINASSTVIFVVGNKTGDRTAGSNCGRIGKENQWEAVCTPYKGNTNGQRMCKIVTTRKMIVGEDVGKINKYSYLQHEFEQARNKNKTIIIVYNSLRKETQWLPKYMKGYEMEARPFWKLDVNGNKIGDYASIKEALGFF